mgnify:CR=1 FL=1
MISVKNILVIFITLILFFQASAKEVVLKNKTLSKAEEAEKAKKSDYLAPLLSAPDVDKLIHWLTQQPLLRKLPDENVYMSHAGLPPQWTIERAISAARSAEKKISSSQRNKWLARMYGEKPNDWYQAKTKTEKFRYTINGLTRMRYCYLDGKLEFNCKTAPEDATDNIKPWYELTTNQIQNYQ